MSIDGFVAKLETREAELNERIAEIIKKDKGERILSHMRKETKELQDIRNALYKAKRVGIH